MPDFTDFLPIRRESLATIRPRVDADANAGIDPDSDRYLDTVPGGFYWDLTQTLLLEIERLWDMAATEAPAVAYPTYAWGEYLDRHGEVLDLPRKSAAYAGGTLRYQGADGTVIASGARVATIVTDPDADPVIVETIQTGTILNGEAMIPARAVEVGVAGNVQGGTLTEPITIVPGVTAITNLLPFTGGAEVESDDLYRARLTVQFAAVQGSGTISDYQRWCLQWPGVGFVTVEPLWAGEGTVRCVVLDTEANGLPQSTVDALQNDLDPPKGLTKMGGQLLTTTPLTVEDTDAFTASGRVYVGPYAINYTGKTAKINPPAAAPTLTPLPTGGTFAVGTYYYRISALNAVGETVTGPEASVAVGANGRVTVTWAAVTGATGYRIYRGSAAGQLTNLQTYLPGNVVTYTDTGTNSPNPTGGSGSAAPLNGDTASFTGTSGGPAGVSYPEGTNVTQGGQGRGRAPIGAEVTVATAVPLAVNVKGTVVHRAGYSLDGDAGTVATRAAINRSLANYINRLPPGEDVVLNHVEAAFFVEGVFDVSGVQIDVGSGYAAANGVIDGLRVAQMAEFPAGTPAAVLT